MNTTQDEKCEFAIARLKPENMMHKYHVKESTWYLNFPLNNSNLKTSSYFEKLANVTYTLKMKRKHIYVNIDAVYRYCK